ncbi:MAG: hypothetical protein AAFQ41_09170 [Cyanobacteria bacterium J06623_7]
MHQNKFINQLSLTCALTLALAGGFSTVVRAQAGTDNPGYQSNEKRSGVYGDAPSGLDPLEIMHRAQQLNGRSAEEFNQDSQLQIDSSASDFKRLQQQRILEQQATKNHEAQALEVEATE